MDLATRKKLIIGCAVLVFVFLILLRINRASDKDFAGAAVEKDSTTDVVQTEATPGVLTSSNATAAAMDAYQAAHLAKQIQPAPTAASADDEASNTRDYVVEDGVAVIDGDIVIGQPGSAGRAAVVGAITPWPTSQIPFFIPDDVPDQERIIQAIVAFDHTSVQFVQYTNQRDVLVFKNAVGTCKSYMGRIGGKQPIFISPNCGAHEIAHELMHALGFLHEQNRTDRDSYITINRENIDGAKILNFEKFPQDFMILSGLAPFDTTSIMIYPAKMFSRNGEPTMKSLKDPIQPGDRLSVQDIRRINEYYGSR